MAQFILCEAEDEEELLQRTLSEADQHQLERENDTSESGLDVFEEDPPTLRR